MNKTPSSDSSCRSNLNLNTKQNPKSICMSVLIGGSKVRSNFAAHWPGCRTAIRQLGVVCTKFRRYTPSWSGLRSLRVIQGMRVHVSASNSAYPDRSHRKLGNNSLAKQNLISSRSQSRWLDQTLFLWLNWHPKRLDVMTLLTSRYSRCHFQACRFKTMCQESTMDIKINETYVTNPCKIPDTLNSTKTEIGISRENFAVDLLDAKV